MAMRWHYHTFFPTDMGPQGGASHQTISAGQVFQVMRHPNGVDSESAINCLLPDVYNYAHLKPEIQIAFATVNFVATGLADWHVKDLAVGDGQAIALPAHDYKLPHNVTAAGSNIWVTPWTTELSVITYTGPWLQLRVQRLAGTGVDTIADDLDIFAVGFRYRIIA